MHAVLRTPCKNYVVSALPAPRWPHIQSCAGVRAAGRRANMMQQAATNKGIAVVWPRLTFASNTRPTANVT